jgi:transcriptional regulator with XRE-family HTH domain
MDVQEIGRQLRSRRAAAGRTVASVALDAGLSVPYVANLENGRGNPTLSALTRLAAALGTELRISLEPVGGGIRAATPISADLPPPLVRLSRSKRFRRLAGLIAATLGAEPDDLPSRMLSGLALATTPLGLDLAEADYWRLIDALTVIVISPAADERSASISGASRARTS